MRPPKKTKVQTKIVYKRFLFVPGDFLRFRQKRDYKSRPTNFKFLVFLGGLTAQWIANETSSSPPSSHKEKLRQRAQLPLQNFVLPLAEKPCSCVSRTHSVYYNPGPSQQIALFLARAHASTQECTDTDMETEMGMDADRHRRRRICHIITRKARYPRTFHSRLGIHTFIYIHTPRYTHIHTYIHTCVLTYVYRYTYIHTYVHT